MYRVAVLFNDGIVATATQKAALEYGCTLDAVGQLASIIDSRQFKSTRVEHPSIPLYWYSMISFALPVHHLPKDRLF
jgi:hypothetical protein